MKLSTFLLVAMMFAGIFSVQSAKADHRPHGGRVFVQCNSYNFNTQYCPVRGFVRGAELIYQLSRSACIQGSTWGYDNRGIWVSNGCRANFYAYTRW
jgi:hypothetical protein